VVEDTGTIGASTICSQCRFEVLEAVDREKGVAMAAGAARIILMDIQLPIVNGYEATRRIGRSELRHIPIIAVTSYALSGDDAKALAGM
jgi:two-component system cell cycle response regulator DivK